MPVSRSIENNVNILANFPTAENISSILNHMPFNHYLCDDFTDVIMIPCFILILDALVLTEDNPAINRFECYLTGWSGRMKKCPQCRNYDDCLITMNKKRIQTRAHEPDEPFLSVRIQKL
jgi:hypothetical protein